jgi:hypothetical protein
MGYSSSAGFLLIGPPQIEDEHVHTKPLIAIRVEVKKSR